MLISSHGLQLEAGLEFNRYLVVGLYLGLDVLG